MYAPAGRPRLPLGRRLLSVVAVAVLLSVLGLAIARATVAAVSVTAVDNVVGTAGADHGISFTSDANPDATGIEVTFPAGYSLAAPGAAGITSTGCASATSGEICVNGTRVAVTDATVSGQTITVTLAATDLTVGTVQFTVTTGITNPETAGTLAAAGFTVATTSATTNAEPPVAAGADVTIVAAPPARVALTGPTAATAGAASSAFTLTMQDQYGNTATVAGNRSFSLSSDAGGTFRDAADATDITQVTVATATSSTQFRYRHTVAGSPTITVTQVSGPALTTSSDTAGITVEAAAPAQVVVSGPASVLVGTSSTAFTVSMRDQFGNASEVAGDTVFGLSSDAGGGTFRDAADTVDVTQLTVPTGSATGQFRYRDTAAGSPTITASRVSGDALATAASDSAGITVQAVPDPDPDPAPAPAPSTTPAQPEPVTEETTTEEVGAGETVTTDPDGAGATRDDPLHAAVTTPNAGTVIIRRQVSWPSPAGFQLVADQLDISAPAGTPESPLVLRLTVDGSAMADATFVVAFRDRALVLPCAVEGGTTAAPDPCLSERTMVGDDTILTLLTSRGRVWNVGVLPRGSIALVCPYPTPGSRFRDVAADAVHAAAIDCVVGQDIAQGTAADRYSPGGVVTRAQMATFVARLLDAAGVRLPVDTSPSFSAIEGKLHGSNIGRLAAAGIVSGRTAASYDPAGPVTREQLATFLVRAFEYATGRDVAEADATFDDVGGTHASNVRRLIGLGITVGVTDTAYAPGEGVRRGQMAGFLGRLLNRLAAEGVGISGLPRSAG